MLVLFSVSGCLWTPDDEGVTSLLMFSWSYSGRIWMVKAGTLSPSLGEEISSRWCVERSKGAS